MSLFVINRYEGDEKVDNKDEENHLSKLLQKIEERKRQRAANNVSVESKEEVNDTEVPKCKKKRKEKGKENIKEEDNLSEAKHESSDKPSKRKKQKKKHVLIEEESVENLDGNDKETQILSNDGLKSTKEELTKEHTQFTVLGSKTYKKNREVKRVLPNWLAHPKIILVDLNSGPNVDDLDTVLDSQLIKVLKSNGINKLFPVQESMVSWLLKCNQDRKLGWWVHDTCVCAPTGSGKTLAYVLPIVQDLQTRLVPKIRCLVVVPVQELAAQVHKVILTYTSHTNLRVALISGAFSFEQEQRNLRKNTSREENKAAVDIVIATPGRLVDHLLKTPEFSLDDLRFLVIDEADRTADWMQYLPEPHYPTPQLTLKNMRNSKIPAQKLLFSATLSQDPEKLNRLGLFQPVLFTSMLVPEKDEDVNLDKELGDSISRYTSPTELTEYAVQCTAQYKPVALYHLLCNGPHVPKTLIFTNSGKMAHRLTVLLQSILSEKNVIVGELSAQLVPKQRETVLGKFAAGEVQVLVSSDALARGVDVPDIQLVISYDLPKYIKGYIHRAGRTGRAGKPGTAVSVLTFKQIGIFKQMLNSAGKLVPRIETLELDSIADEINYPSHVEKLKNTLEDEKESNLKRTKAVKRMRPNLLK